MSLVGEKGAWRFRKAAKLLQAAILISALISGISPPFSPVIRPINATQDYFPLEVGNSWTYEWSNTIYHPSIITEAVTAVSKSLVSGTIHHEIVAFWYLSDVERAGPGHLIIERTADGFYMDGYALGGTDPFPIPWYMIISYLGPAPGGRAGQPPAAPPKILQIPLNVGDSWTWTGRTPGRPAHDTVPSEYLNYTASSVALRFESISVPAGMFYCILVKTEIMALDGLERSKNFLSGTRYMWFADGVGLVKLTYYHNDGSVTEAKLVEHRQAPFLNPPETPPPPYIPSSTQEDITSVELTAFGGMGSKRSFAVKVTFASETPPDGQEIIILPTTLIGNPPSERPAPAWGFIPVGGAPSNTYAGWVMLDLDASYTENGYIFIAIYAWLSGAKTDRAPDTGMYRIALDTPQPNTFTDSPDTSPPPPQPPKPSPYPVGGVLTPASKPAILAPYMALIGLAALAVVAVKRRRC